jgi:hypothetical protein
MRKAFLVVAMGAVSLFIAACNKGDADTAGPKVEQQQGDGKTDSSKPGIVAAIRGKTLPDFATATIGEAFDKYRYFDKREWKETRSSNGKTYVDFWGWLNSSSPDAVSAQNGVVASGVQVKFVITPNGEFYVAMISRVEAGADGKEHDYPLEDKKRILEAIYANNKITF